MEIVTTLDEKFAARFNAMMDSTGITLPQELINEALTFFEWAINQSHEGRIIGALNEKTGGYVQVQMVSLNYAREKGFF